MAPRFSFRSMIAWAWRVICLLILTSLLVGSTVPLADPKERPRRFTRHVEFDFFGWTLDAVWVKLKQFSVGNTRYLREEDRAELVLEYMDMVRRASEMEARLVEVYGDPSITDAEANAAQLAAEQADLRSTLSQMQPLVEAILEEQTSVVLANLEIDFAGVPFPPVAFHFSQVPMALIVSPRDEIKQDASIQLNPGLTVSEQVELETQVEQAYGVSALVEPVGGIGVYPTMIQETTSPVWLVETIVHEWVHNYLTLRPLGFRYGVNSDLRTMNETVASILGREIGRKALQRFYPEHVPPPPVEPSELSAQAPQPPPVFDFRAEMHETRVNVDALLEVKMVEEAERYMESRRQIFWANGYRIRRLNQAYFAFHGAYASEPGGAAGEDPVGEAVRALWDKIASPAQFLRTMAWMTDFSDLEEALAQPATIR